MQGLMLKRLRRGGSSSVHGSFRFGAGSFHIRVVVPTGSGVQ